jgi:Holliday junction resolvase RusA-like endonuclease
MFTVPGVFPSLNVLLGWHWAKRGKHRKDIEWAIHHELAWMEVDFIAGAKSVMAVDLTIYQPYRRLDQDNAEGSMKPVIDSLRSLGLIYRDSPKWLKKTITQEVDRKNPRVEVSISEIGTEGKP